MTGVPKISIVTVVYNDVEEIESTIRSILDQTYDPLELIVIDGKSTDGTIEKLEPFRQDIHHFLSEPDKGIYDAMNKGISLATGDWIYFLNAGDQFSGPEILNEIVPQLNQCDLAYGKHGADYGYFERVHTPGTLDELKHGMIFSHQAMFVRTDLLKKNPFDLQYKLASDYNFIYQLYKEGKTFRQIENVVASLKAEGVSELQISKTHAERRKISCSYETGWARFQLQWWYFWKAIKLRIIQFAKFILPRKTKQKLTMRKYS